MRPVVVRPQVWFWAATIWVKASGDPTGSIGVVLLPAGKPLPSCPKPSVPQQKSELFVRRAHVW
jgi:hypothetical protein